ncbi:carbohydrate binding domain-containing protein, partial [Alkalibacterium sp. AK22]|uniref:carbohydrate binding domain-containing protein n=1 Tax=Alkalibacterium sp. AK22 TaxID=1229520 RepID=UPI00068437E7
MTKSSKKFKTLCLASILVLNAAGPAALSVSANSDNPQMAATSSSQTIHSMQATSPTTITAGMDGSIGFTFPNFNNGASFESVADDVDLLVEQNGEWISIDNNASSGWVYDSNFGNFWDGPGGYWFNPVQETMNLRVASKSNPSVYVEYTFVVIPANTQLITSMAASGPTTLDVSPSGGTGFQFPNFNGGATFKDVQGDVALFVKQGDDWVSIDNNAGSGWVYDNNFGNWWEGPGGYWFDPVEETTSVRIASRTSPDVFVDYTLRVTLPNRNSHRLSNFDGRATFEADRVGAVGIPIPRIDGGYATKSEVDNFVYEVMVDGEWVNILETQTTGFSYSASGYNRNSSATQWGYWTDHIFGLWFQPLQEDVDFRIGYPLDGEKGGDIGDNYVQYKFVGNPDAHRPDNVVLDDISVGTSEDPALEGWDLVWHDEFEGDQLDESKWNYDTGYYLNDDPGTWGWGNEELQHYTDSEDNVFVEDGKLNIVAFEDPKSFPQDPEREAQYASGKLTTQDKFSFTYGRVDFSAKLPAVTGAWPALWMMPNDDVYGGWASSGEIDVMEARGRVPGSTSGAIHFGGEWPGNTYIEGKHYFDEGVGIDTDFHVYSLIWEEDMLSWYVNGEFFFNVSKEEWFSAAARENPTAPFDQDFYLIMNLAIGGWFDGGRVPDADELPASMQVEYVRVYSEPEPEIIAVSGIELNRSAIELTTEGQRSSLQAAVLPAEATNKRVSWSSSDESVATVSGTGVVTAIANGEATITATTEDGKFVDTAEVIVDIIPQLTKEQMFPLKNGDFSDDLAHWSALSAVDGESFVEQVQVNRGRAELAIPALGSAQADAVQFKQTGLNLYEGEEYLLSFDAQSTLTRDMELLLENSGGQNVFEQRFTLSADEQRYSTSFTATADEVVDLTFLLGQYADYSEHAVSFDNVILEIKNPAINQIKNSDFSNGSASWDLWSDVGATSAVSDEKQQITIPTLGSEFWSVQFSQAGFRLEENTAYRLVFDMSSTTGRTIDAIIESNNFDKYLWESVTVDENTGTYALEFTHTHGTDPAAKLVFALGKVDGQEAIGEHVVEIDNVFLYEIPAFSAGESGEPAEPVVPKEGYGVGSIKENSVEFYVNNAPWAILHYIKNGEGQQNVMMDPVAENYSVFNMDVEQGDIIRYWFTYGLTEGQQDEYPAQLYIHDFQADAEEPTDPSDEDEDVEDPTDPTDPSEDEEEDDTTDPSEDDEEDDATDPAEDEEEDDTTDPSEDDEEEDDATDPSEDEDDDDATDPSEDEEEDDATDPSEDEEDDATNPSEDDEEEDVTDPSED